MALRAVSTIGATGGATGTLPVFIAGYPNASLTGSITESNLAAIRIPANSIGPNGTIRLTTLWSFTNNTNVKTITIRQTATSGAVAGGFGLQSGSLASQAVAQLQTIIKNAGTTGNQVGFPNAGLTPFGASVSALVTSTVDTTADTFIGLNATLAVGTDTITLLGYTVEISHA